MKHFEYYKVGYIYMNEQIWAVYFNLISAQSAMKKMITRGVHVTGLESDRI